jgi:hypothetical protein
LVELVENVCVRAGCGCQGDHLGRLLGRHAGFLLHLGDHLVRTDFAQLVERPQEDRRLPLKPELGEQSVQHEPAVHPDFEPLEPKGHEQVVDHQRGFDVGGVRLRADRVKVALHELAEPAGLRALAPPDGAEVVALER